MPGVGWQGVSFPIPLVDFHPLCVQVMLDFHQLALAVVMFPADIGEDIQAKAAKGRLYCHTRLA